MLAEEAFQVLHVGVGVGPVVLGIEPLRRVRRISEVLGLARVEVIDAPIPHADLERIAKDPAGLVRRFDRRRDLVELALRQVLGDLDEGLHHERLLCCLVDDERGRQDAGDASCDHRLTRGLLGLEPRCGLGGSQVVWVERLEGHRGPRQSRQRVR